MCVSNTVAHISHCLLTTKAAALVVLLPSLFDPLYRTAFHLLRQSKACGMLIHLSKQRLTEVIQILRFRNVYIRQSQRCF